MSNSPMSIQGNSFILIEYMKKMQLVRNAYYKSGIEELFHVHETGWNVFEPYYWVYCGRLEIRSDSCLILK